MDAYRRKLLALQEVELASTIQLKAQPDLNGVTKGVRMRSGFEVMFARILEQRGEQFEYEPKCFVLAPGVRYTPDFYVPTENKYYEVKGWLKETAMNKI